tara:strand:+ start:1689 stop:2651 length:963 start_codon:yes stop_codon:yes gene_type:complete
MKNYFKNLSLIFFSIIFTLFFIEFFLIIKSKFLIDYDVEMWKYSKLLKRESINPKINHVHVKNSSAKLQGVIIQTDSIGARGDNKNLHRWKLSDNKILILGSSVTLGWGVEEKNTMVSKLNQISIKNKKSWHFLNAGVGNYNTERYVSNYFENLSMLNPDTLIIQFFLNDPENLNNEKGNLITRNFHVGVLLWKYYNSIIDNVKFTEIYDYYLNVYNDKNLKKTLYYLKKIKKHCDLTNKKKCLVLYTPDIQFLGIEKYDLFEKKIKLISRKANLPFYSFTKPLLNEKKRGIKLKNKYKDNHPNQLAHNIMAVSLFNYLK